MASQICPKTPLDQDVKGVLIISWVHNILYRIRSYYNAVLLKFLFKAIFMKKIRYLVFKRTRSVLRSYEKISGSYYLKVL